MKLNPQEITITAPHPYTLSVTIGKQTHTPVECVLLFPLTEPTRSISLCMRKEGKLEEVGIIDDLNALSKKQRALVEEQLAVRYFFPEITDVFALDETNGVYTVTARTDKGDVVFSVNNIRENVGVRDDGMVVIMDIEKRRYKVSRYDALTEEAKQLLDRIIL